MRVLLIASLLLLTACQGPRLQRDFDPARDFAGYRSWQWQEPAVRFRPDDPRLTSDLNGQRIEQAVTEQLEQLGLRPAAESQAADLRVQAWLIVDDRQQQITTSYGGAWGNGWNGYWGGPVMQETRNLDYQVGTLQIDLYDGRDGKLVWRGSAEQILRHNLDSPEQRSQAIRQTVRAILNQYPPR